ncbi:heparan-alpha-glucosaminide N-acetyltransferase [Chelativorans sp. YIM 93263]|uniref:heparan-alpha-glucosaminide N-acetyltransferase n=1 Tax=Chelativorans sp. YIM 93263 TaxID=2906648 RepID=UPI002378D80A|nr:heparan-alpha-glucosaminide N-acetyltransferase [Chelativorans sp. YIM 93263]
MQSDQVKLPRIELIDIARGGALVAMAVYHFTWDLDAFGYLEPGTSVTGGWKIFARSIASSFLFLVGVSLYLAHGQGIRLHSFAKRLGVIILAAGAITLVTYFATPNGFIYFGILHHIAVASVLGLLILRLPVVILLPLAAAVITAPHYIHADFLNQPAFWWTGLSNNVRPSNDFFPIFPWFSAVILGIAATKFAALANLLQPMAAIRPARKLPLLPAIGQHSLAFYLLHQPVLISAVWLFVQVVPPPATATATFNRDACTTQCAAERDEAFCRAYCSCVFDNAEAQNRLDDLYATQPDEETRNWLNDLAFQCTVENNGQSSAR